MLSSGIIIAVNDCKIGKKLFIMRLSIFISDSSFACCREYTHLKFGAKDFMEWQTVKTDFNIHKENY